MKNYRFRHYGGDSVTFKAKSGGAAWEKLVKKFGRFQAENFSLEKISDIKKKRNNILKRYYVVVYYKASKGVMYKLYKSKSSANRSIAALYLVGWNKYSILDTPKKGKVKSRLLSAKRYVREIKSI